MAKELNVVFLDDEDNILQSLKRLFSNEFYQIETTTDYKKALDLIDKHNIKVVISDQRMPEISGVEFLKQVKERSSSIIRILFTGYADIQAAEAAVNIGEVYRFINKPWNNDDLKSTIRQAMKHYDLIIENKKLFESTQMKNNELERLNEKLRNMYEVQKEFSSTVSHELRTPLTSIKTAIDIVMSSTTGSLTEDQSKFLKKAQNNVDRLSRLINDILNLSKLESGKSIINLAEKNLNAIVEEIVGLQKPVAEKKDLFLKTELDPHLPRIYIDEDKMFQVLNNLIGNAIKFTEQGGIVLTTESATDKNHIKILIKDTGEGIKDEDRSKLFQKFQQLGDPSNRRTGGTGLGLAICKEIVKQHHGKIGVESVFGEGSTFFIVLPICERRNEGLAK